jgi:hypothetical protein
MKRGRDDFDDFIDEDFDNFISAPSMQSESSNSYQGFIHNPLQPESSDSYVRPPTEDTRNAKKERLGKIRPYSRAEIDRTQDITEDPMFRARIQAYEDKYESLQLEVRNDPFLQAMHARNPYAVNHATEDLFSYLNINRFDDYEYDGPPEHIQHRYIYDAINERGYRFNKKPPDPQYTGPPHKEDRRFDQEKVGRNIDLLREITDYL